MVTHKWLREHEGRILVSQLIAMSNGEVGNAGLMQALINRRCSNDEIKSVDVWNVMDRRAIVSGDVMTVLGHAFGNPIDAPRLTDLLK